MLESIFQILMMAITYYLFSREFFKFLSKIKSVKPSLMKQLIMFLIVYVWFLFASYLELPLIINWFVFMIILGLEIRNVFVFDYLVSYALSMFCIINGLAMNIFFRSLISIVSDIPLNVFDKTLNSVRAYPIFLGFIGMVLLLVCLQRFNFASRLKRLLENRKSLIFYTRTELFIYLFLIIQLLLYSQSDNSIGVKLWGIKSSIFSIIILVITIIYSLRVASLYYYMDKKHEMRNQLLNDKEDIDKFWDLAYTDILTGCGNRQLLDKRLEEYAGYGGDITIAFIDVNGLKNVNDMFGHAEGDKYLLKIVKVLLEITYEYNVDLFRYGGDEFVMMSNSLDEHTLTELLNERNTILANDENKIYQKSISFGVVRGESINYSELIKYADEKMYQFKMQHYEDLARI